MIDYKKTAINAIKNKLIGKELNYNDAFALMHEISQNSLGAILTTYFAASGYANGFSSDELYFLTKAMVENGEKLKFEGIIADKHSIGGLPGGRTTMIVVPIVAAAGFKIPKSSSRAITTPDGTADDMEILSQIEFDRKKLYEIVEKHNGCIVWGGSFNIAPADDILIQVEKPLMFESFDKIVVSIMAKKVAFGSNHIVIDIPYGRFAKVKHKKDASILAKKFVFISKKFNIEVKTVIHKVFEPIGQGIGPVLETRDALLVLEQNENRPIDLEKEALILAGNLLEICLNHNKNIKNKYKKEYKINNGLQLAKYILLSGQALVKMKDIIKAQLGNPQVNSNSLIASLGEYKYHLKANKNGIIKEINSQNITELAKILGAPHEKGSGIFLEKKVNNHITKDEILATFYSENEYNLKQAIEKIAELPIFYF